MSTEPTTTTNKPDPDTLSPPPLPLKPTPTRGSIDATANIADHFYYGTKTAVTTTSRFTIAAFTALIEYFKPFFKTIELNALNVAAAFNVTDRTTFWGRLTKFYLIPDGPFLFFWDRFVIAMSYLNGLLLVFMAAFRDDHFAPFLFAYFVDLVFFLDMYFKFHVAFLSGGFWLIIPRDMALNYIKSFEFKWDVISNLPTDILILFFVKRDRETRLFILTLLRLNRWLRTLKMITWFFKQERRLHSSYQLQISKFLCYITTLLHTVACIWYTLACPSDKGCRAKSWVGVQGINRNETSTRSMYIHSLYWAAATITTTGYGDIRPDNDFERAFALICMIMGTFFFAYASGIITSVISNLDSQRIALQQRVNAMLTYMRDRRVDTKYQRRVVEWYEYQWERHKGVDIQEIFSDLPTAVKSDLLLHMNKDVIQKMALFRDCSVAFQRSLATKLRMTIYTTSEYVVHKGDIGEAIYMIVRGRVDTFDEDIKRPHASYIDGSYYGDVELLLGQHHQLNARAAVNTDMYTLLKSDVDELCSHFPEDKEIILKRTQARYKQFLLAKQLKPPKLRNVNNTSMEMGIVKSSLGDGIGVSSGSAVTEQMAAISRATGIDDPEILRILQEVEKTHQDLEPRGSGSGSGDGSGGLRVTSKYELGENIIDRTAEYGPESKLVVRANSQDGDEIVGEETDGPVRIIRNKKYDAALGVSDDDEDDRYGLIKGERSDEYNDKEK